MNFLLVAIGGFFGSMARFFIVQKTGKRPIGTWIANTLGSVLLAALLRFYLNGHLPDWFWHLAGAGFSGAFTTFSTFGNETLQLVLAQKYKTAALYVFGSLAITLTAAGLII
ncbi:fluoride efflux transporter CrcB [Virgibacillus siamensis]|uniref:Fluoride-specific ion channel FluC n=1 Tax=Virgibacillus siamensis TaxID=480071 RepID=A0ABP3QJU7_9BACI